MERASEGPILSAVFVDYDNIYLSLKRKSEEAAKRFAKDTGRWLAALQSGELITTNGGPAPVARRMVMNRCYGNPVPRRNQVDNSTDMNSFPFVRHHFLRNGFEIVDCPPLTAQLKNSSDIKMVMDLRDFLTHETYFHEFLILSSDADFTPVLHRLRAHNRRTVIFANDNTAAPYTAIADGEVRENDLIRLLLDEAVEGETRAAIEAAPDLEEIRAAIIGAIAKAVRTAPAPMPLEAAAQRATSELGASKTTGTKWGGAGGFLELLKSDLPADIKLSGHNPPVLYDQSRVINRAEPQPQPLLTGETVRDELRISGGDQKPAAETPVREARPESRPDTVAREPEPVRATREPEPQNVSDARGDEPRGAQGGQAAVELQKSIKKIHDASKAPPLSPPDYRVLFEVMAQEIDENQPQGVKTIVNVQARAAARGVELRREDIRFVMDVVGESDPWFEQGVSANIFSGRFRNFVVARCRTQSLSLSTEELDLIETWFAGGAALSNMAPARLGAHEPVSGQAPSSAQDQRSQSDDARAAEMRPGQAEHQPTHETQSPIDTQDANSDGSAISYESLSNSELGNHGGEADDMPRFVRSPQLRI